MYQKYIFFYCYIKNHINKSKGSCCFCWELSWVFWWIGCCTGCALDQVPLTAQDAESACAREFIDGLAVCFELLVSFPNESKDDTRLDAQISLDFKLGNAVLWFVVFCKFIDIGDFF